MLVFLKKILIIILKPFYVVIKWIKLQKKNTSFLYSFLILIKDSLVPILRSIKSFCKSILQLIYKFIEPLLISLLKNKISASVIIVGLGLISFIIITSNQEEVYVEVAIEDRPNFDIGVIVSITGKYARIGNEMRRGYETVINTINQNGGIKVNNETHNLNLIIYDDESEPIRAAEVSRSLITESKPPVILAPYSASLAQPVINYAQINNIPVIVPVASPAYLDNEVVGVFKLQTPPEKYLVSAASLYLEQIEKIRQSETEEKERFANGAKPRIIFANSEDPISKLIITTVKEYFRNDEDIELIDYKFGLAKKESDAQKKVISKSDAMFVSADANGASQLMETIATDGINIPYIALTHCDVAKIHIKTPTAAESALCAVHWQSEANFIGNNFVSTSVFISDYENNYGSVPTYRSAAAAAAINVLYEALKISINDDSVDLADALYQTNLDTLYGPIVFNQAGINNAKPMVISQIRNSRFEPVLPTDIAMRKVNLLRPKLATSIK